MFLYQKLQKQRELQGDFLSPLNVLKTRYPEYYKTGINKYKDRMHETKLIIPKINCLWNDVLFFTAIEPLLLHSELQLAGMSFSDNHAVKYARVNIEKLDLSKLFILYKTPNPQIILPEQVQLFRMEDYSVYSEITETTRAHYKELISKGEKPFLYYDIPEILYYGEIPIEDLEIFMFKQKA